MKKSLFTIQRMMIAFGMTIIALLTFLALQTYNSIENVRIGSKDYMHIVLGKDMVADILPPPLFPAEAFSYLNVLDKDPSLLS